MTQNNNLDDVRMIPIDRIDVLYPSREIPNYFWELERHIQTFGLKSPITVTPRYGADGIEKYLLVCGELRLKAFRSLRNPYIPAHVIKVSDEDLFIMNLASSERYIRRRSSKLQQGELHDTQK